MIIRLLSLLTFFTLSLSKLADNDTLLPVMHIKETAAGFLTFPDKQLGIDEPPEVPTTPCIPRAEAEASKRITNVLQGENEKPPFNDTRPYNGTEVVEELFELRTIRPQCDD